MRPTGINSVNFFLNYRDETIPVRLPLPGKHSVYTALRAAAVGLMAGLSWEEIVAGLEMEQTQLRMITKRLPNGAMLIDDTYNASPKSMMAALDLLENAAGRKVAILGGMLELGVDERAGHERVGARAAAVADLLITVGELGKMIADSALANGMDTTVVWSAADPAVAVSTVEELIRPTDTILVKASRGIGLDRLVSSLTGSN